MKVILFALGALATMLVIVSVDVVKPQVSKVQQSVHAAQESQRESSAAPRQQASRRKQTGHSPVTGKTESVSDEAETLVRSPRADGDPSSAAETQREGERSRAAANSGAVILNGSKPAVSGTGEAHSQGSSATPTPAPSNADQPGSSSPGSNSQHSSSPRSSAASQTNAEKSLDKCSRCESMPHDENMSCPDSYGNCRSLPGVIGPEHPKLAGMSKGALCMQILDCIHQTKCAGPNASGGPATTDCLCGRDIDPDRCFRSMTVSQTQGACRDLMVAGTEVEELEQIAMRFFDPTSATGAAVAVVESCDMISCAKECL